MAWMIESCIVAAVWPPVMELPVVNFVGSLSVAVVSSLSLDMSDFGECTPFDPPCCVIALPAFDKCMLP